MAEDNAPQTDELGELPTRPDRVSTSAAVDSARFADFDAEVSEATGDPVTFRLSGELFTCLDPLPLGSVAVFARRTARLAGVKGMPEEIVAVKMAELEGEALGALLPPGELERLENAMARHPDPMIAQKVYKHVITQATGRPTTPS